MTRPTQAARKPILTLTLIAGLGLSMTACTQEESGSLWGALIGGLVGSAVAGDSRDHDFAVFAGAAIGSSIGAAQGRKLDEADEIRMQRAYTRAMEDGRSGERVTWSNPDTGNSGTYQPEPAYQNPYNEFCREYTQTIKIGGEEEQAYGEACRQPDGSWKVSD